MLLKDLKVVLKVAEFQSITSAADHLDMRTATASAAVKRVERALGVELFVRTTRSLRLSSAGERFLPQCEKALALLEQAHQKIREDLDIIDGELRISVSSDLGRNLVVPWLDEFMEIHPQLRVRVTITDSNVDFFRDSVDMAIRYGSPSDASIYGFKLCNVPRLLCASPEYISAHGSPRHPHDLPGHNSLLYQLRERLHDVWVFSRNTEKYKVKVTGNRAGNDGELVRRWCVSGKGIAAKSSVDMAMDLLAGRVVHLMPEYTLSSTQLWLLFPSKELITPATRLLREFLREKCENLLQTLADKGILAGEEGS